MKIKKANHKGRDFKGKTGVNVGQSHDGTARVPQRPMVPGYARHHQGSCRRAHHVAAHASAFPSARDTAQDATLFA
jgi:hypothetical protein